MKTLYFKNKLLSYSHALVLETVLTISFNKLPRSFNLLNGSRLYYETIKCEINSAFCSVTTDNPAVTSPTEQLYEQMKSNPAFTKRNIQNFNAYLLNILVRSYCIWLVNTLTSTALIGSPIICMRAPADICEQWERNLTTCFSKR